MCMKYYRIELDSNFLIYTSKLYEEIEEDDEMGLYNRVKEVSRSWVNEWLYSSEGIPDTTRVELTYNGTNKEQGEISLVINGIPGYTSLGGYRCEEITQEEYVEGKLL